MQCPNCRYPLEDSDVLCPICGSVITPEKQDDAAVAVAVKDKPVPETKPTVNTAKKPRKKSKRTLIIVLITVGILLAAAGVVAAGFIFGWWGKKPAEPVGTSADLYNAVSALASSQSLTLTVDTNTSYNGMTETDKLIIKFDRTAKKLSSERTLTHDGIVTVDKTAIDADSRTTYYQNGTALPHGCVEHADQTAVWTPIDGAMTALGNQKSLYDLLTNIKTGTFWRYIDAGYINLDGLKTDLTAIDVHFKDEAWLKNHVGFTASRDGEDDVFAFHFDAGKLMTQLTDELTHSFKDEATYTLVKEAVAAWSGTFGGKPCDITVRVRNGAIMTIKITATVDKASVTATVTPSARNQTAVDISGIKATVLKANQSYETCFVCAQAPACIVGYCDACYYASFCKNDDNNAVFKDGYCEACFVKCDGCGEHHAVFTAEQALCATCYHARFCLNGDGNAVFKDGYCEACFEPCRQCGEKAGDAYFDGRCAACFNASSAVTVSECVACKAALYGNGFEKDGYTLCFDCYTGAVSMCHYCQTEVAYFQNGQSRLCRTCYYRHILNKACSRCGATGLLLSHGNETLCTSCYPDI